MKKAKSVSHSAQFIRVRCSISQKSGIDDTDQQAVWIHENQMSITSCIINFI